MSHHGRDNIAQSKSVSNVGSNRSNKHASVNEVMDKMKNYTQMTPETTDPNQGLERGSNSQHNGSHQQKKSNRNSKHGSNLFSKNGGNSDQKQSNTQIDPNIQLANCAQPKLVDSTYVPENVVQNLENFGSIHGSKGGSNHRDQAPMKFSHKSNHGDGEKTTSFGKGNGNYLIQDLVYNKKVVNDTEHSGLFSKNKNLIQEMRKENLSSNSNWNAKSQQQAYTVNTDVNTFGNTKTKSQFNKSSYVTQVVPRNMKNKVTLEVDNFEPQNNFMPNFQQNRFKVE
jgi:hypothetical protein